jgi:hypothetical protein
LTAANFGGQLNNIETYRSALDKMVRSALVAAANKSNPTIIQEQHINIPVEIITQIEGGEDQQQASTTTATDTREYTEKRLEINDEH